MIWAARLAGAICSKKGNFLYFCLHIQPFLSGSLRISDQGTVNRVYLQSFINQRP